MMTDHTLISTLQTDAEFKELYLTYKPGNYTHRAHSKVFEPDPYQDYPESIDWRTKNAVTGIKNQVANFHCSVYTIKHIKTGLILSFLLEPLTMFRANAVPAMPSVLWLLLRGRGLLHMIAWSLSVSRTLSTAQVSTCVIRNYAHSTH